MKKAIAYTSDIVLGSTGEVIKREYQKELIKKHAAENNIEVVAWFEDAMYNEDVMSRSGIQAMLAHNEPYDMVITERVWSLSRSMNTLEGFFKELDRRGVTFECSTTMWDCTSQKTRRRFNPALPAVKAVPVATHEQVVAVRIKKPAHFHVLPYVTRRSAQKA
ncbi:MAG: recombinase family protein [Myxococcota bacterium]